MNLYLVKRTDCIDWDEYAGMVVAAASEDAARQLHPAALHLSDHHPDKRHDDVSMNEYFLDEDVSSRQWGWVNLDEVSTLTVTMIGTAVYTEPTVILTDYQAG